MVRTFSLLGCCALLLSPSAASASVLCGPEICRLPITVASASGGISGTGGYNDTGESGSTAGTTNDMPDTGSGTNTTGTSSSTTTHHHHSSSGGNGNSHSGSYNNNSSNSNSGGGAYNGGPAGTAAPHQ